MATDFQTNLRAQLEENPDEHRRLRKHLDRIDQLSPKRQKMAWERIERRLRREAGMKTEGFIDWSSIDWKQVLTWIVKILMVIIPIILMFI